MRKRLGYVVIAVVALFLSFGCGMVCKKAKEVPVKEKAEALEEKIGKWVELFNGKDLTGWRPLHEGWRSGWTAENGVLVNKFAGSDLITEEKFMDFELHIEFNVPRGGNSGVYLQGRYEIQVDDCYGQGIRKTMCGAIYGRIAPKVNAAKQAGEWQSFDVKFFSARRDETGKLVKKARVTVIHNGIPIIEDAEIDGVTGGSMDDNEGTPGPLRLQGDHGPIQYRNIRIKPL